MTSTSYPPVHLFVSGINNLFTKQTKSKRPINLWTGHAHEIMRTKVEKSWAETDKHLEVRQEEEEDEEEGESHLRGHE